MPNNWKKISFCKILFWDSNKSLLADMICAINSYVIFVFEKQSSERIGNTINKININKITFWVRESDIIFDYSRFFYNFF